MHRAGPPQEVVVGGAVGRRVSWVAVLRAAVAAGGAVAGVVVAIPLGALLATWLFAHVGKRVVDEIVAGGVAEGLSGFEAVVAAVFLAIAAIMVAVIVVFALVAPVFVVLPMLGSALALRVTGAGLILRTLWLSLAALVVLVVGVAAVLQALDVRTDWWLWAVVVALASFVGRFVVEVWTPRAAGVRTPVVVSRRWKVLVVVWLCLVVVAAAAGTALFLVVV